MMKTEWLALEWLRSEASAHEQTRNERDQARADADELRKRLADLEAEAARPVGMPPRVETPEDPTKTTPTAPLRETR